MRKLHVALLQVCLSLLLVGNAWGRSGRLERGLHRNELLEFDHENELENKRGGIRTLLVSEAATLGSRRDAEALLAFKAGITDDPSGVLAPWNLTLNPNVCDWGKVVRCTDSGRVRAVILGPLYFNGSLTGYELNGTISPSLGKLDRLVTLDLSNNSLSGEIPKELAKLSSLEVLRLSFNNLTGGIPTEFGRLSSLKVLDMGVNSFNGSTLPASLGNLKNLVELYANSSTLEGSIPTELLGLEKLETLILQDNLLSGPIPPELTNSSVYILDLSHNRFTGSVPPLGRMRNILSLDLSYNPLTGTLPTSLVKAKPTLKALLIQYTNISGPIPKVYGSLFGSGTSTDYEYYGVEIDVTENFLYLAGNQLTGSIPPELADLASISELNLEHNELTGNIPESFRRMTTITNLILNNNQLSGTIPDIFANLTLLEDFEAAFNYFTGPIPPSLQKKADCKLATLLLNDNLLTGSIPTKVATCPSLVELNLKNNRLSGPIPDIKDSLVEILDLNNNRFTGQIPDSLGSLKFLRVLDLGKNLLTGSVPVALFGLPNVSTINLSANKLDKPLPDLSSLSPGPTTSLDSSGNASPALVPSSLASSSVSFAPLTSLDLSGNTIPGPIPPSLAKLDILSSLNMNKNRLSGAIPAQLGSLELLKDLVLSHNALTGSIPPQLGNLTELAHLRLENNNLTGGIPSSLGFLPGLVLLDLSNNELSSSLPGTLGNLSNLQTLTLAHNKFSGPIPPELGTLFLLVQLDLSDNDLSGSIPPNLSSLSSLSDFNLSNNALAGIVPAGNLTRFGASSYYGNDGLCGGPLEACPSPPGGDSLSTGAIAGIAAGGAAAFVIFLVLLVLFICWRRSYEDDEGEFSLFQKMGAPLNMRIILEATDNFSPKKILGEGGFGAVYKVVLKDGTEIAVKRLKDGTSQGLLEVKTEMETLGKIKHKNLVQLYGAYIGKKEALLLYEFLPGGDLDGYLYEPKKSKPFEEWNLRHNVLIDSARGLKYLHHEAPLTIIHRDMKPPNILFDNEMNGKVADFGLAKEMDMTDKTHLSTTVSGTIGYLAPEYATSGKLTPKSDVFAYGIVLLQVLTGKRPGEESLGDFGLAKWVHKTWKEQGLKSVLDPRLKVQSTEETQVIGALRLGLMCASKVPSNRPTMDEVVYLLENLDIFEEHPGMGPGTAMSDLSSVASRDYSGGLSFGSGGATNSQRSDLSLVVSGRSNATSGDSVASIAPLQRSLHAI